MFGAARLLLGLTQAEVAARSGISPRSVYMVENGAAGIVTAERLMKHYSKCGIVFIPPEEGTGWAVRLDTLVTGYERDP